MSTATGKDARAAIAFIRENREMFASVSDEQLAEMELTAKRGDILTILDRKTTFSSDVPEKTKENPNPVSAQSLFADMLSALAAEFAAGVKKSGTSGNHRLSIPTEYGQFTCELVPEKTVGNQS